MFLIVGYLCAGRSFAYLGLPWFSLYIGEIALAAFLFFGPRTRQGSWLGLVQRVKRLRRFEWLLLVFLLYGAIEALHGILSGYPALTAARDTAFNYYPLYLFLGVWVGLRGRSALNRIVHILAWWNGCYGLAYVLFLNRLPLTVPGTAHAASAVPLFTEPYGSAISILGLLAFESKPRRVWYLLALNAAVMLFVQVRAEWVGFSLGLLVFAWCTRRIRQVFVAGAVVVALLGALYVTHISIRSPVGRGGKISADYLVARALAPVDKRLATGLSTQKEAGFYSDTVEWRLVWWAAIWHEMQASVPRAMFGFGYGYPLGSLNPFIEPGQFIQTPHDDLLYALGYSGWLGVTLFALLQAELLRLLRRSYRITGQPFGLMCWAAFLAMSMFEDFFEAPFGAIPFFLLIGIALAPALLATRGEKPARVAARPQPEIELAEV